MGTKGKGIPTASSKKMYSINLKNHCLLCLREQEPTVITKLLSANPKGIGTFQPLMCYLTGTRHEDENPNRPNAPPKTKNIPPLCVLCYDRIAEIYRLHQQLLEVQLKIHVKTKLMRNVVRRTRVKNATGELTRREDFLSKLTNSDMPPQQISMVKGFVNKLHDQIIGAGGSFTLNKL